jgi:peptidoglycan-associated lipoprotein
MILSKIYKNTLLILMACLVLTACATKKEVAIDAIESQSQMQGDVYTGTDSVEYLADGVPDRVFFATNETILTTASRETLRAQAAWLRKNSSINVVLEGHADERGTREYNLALGERRANSAKDYLMTYGVSSDRISVLSYGKERPVDAGSNPLAWSKNRRSVTVKAN